MSNPTKYNSAVGAELFGDALMAGSESAVAAELAGVTVVGRSIFCPAGAEAALAKWVGFRFEVALDNGEVRREITALARMYAKLAAHDENADPTYVAKANTLAGAK